MLPATSPGDNAKPRAMTNALAKSALVMPRLKLVEFDAFVEVPREDSRVGPPMLSEIYI